MLAEINPHGMAADLVLLVHFSYVAFVVVGLLLVWIGYFRGWAFVRNVWFRGLHVLSMAIVVLESVFGIECPLTTWEHSLRLRAGQGGLYEKSFMEHWIHRIMFFELEPSTFTVIYVAFFLAVVASFVWVRPSWPRTPERRWRW
jgi:hypothetical protein